MNKPSSSAMAAARETEAWKETAAQAYRDRDFYRGIVVQIGEMFGREAYISDDGSVQQDVLALKVPELVAKHMQIPEGQWIACSERMPDADTQCWVALSLNGKRREGQAYAIWTGEDWFLDLKDSGDFYSRQEAIKDGLDVDKVTHWMPLPAPPKGDEG